ncbi:MAG: HAD family hydrolase [Chloroflexi bacterium]|nr:HAD family hydrolase [Chloroflexota bacterium]
MKLIIFDLDQTLVDLIAIHDRSTREIFKKRFGVDARLTEIDFAGRSLVDNFLELARLKGLAASDVRRQIKEVLEAYERVFMANVPPDISRHVLPGALEVLDALSRTDNITVLYTGNSPRITSRVLQGAKLDRYFKFTLSGTEVGQRSDMIKLAIEKAGELTGKEFRGKDVVVIGDSVRDIEAGRPFGALTIAVATGFHSPEMLAEQEPDFIFHNLEDTGRVMEIVLEAPRLALPR